MMRRIALIAVAALAALALAACGGSNNGAVPQVAPTVAANIPADINDIIYLPNGQTVGGQLAGRTTAKLYAFNASQGDNVTVSMTPVQGSTLDPYIVVLNNAGGVMAVDDNSGEVPGAAVTSFSVPENGTYMVIASDAQTIDGINAQTITGTQNFVVTATGYTEPADQGQRILYFRREIEPGVPPGRRGYSSPLEPVYFYTFQGEAGDVIDVQMYTGDFDTMVSLYDPDGNRIAVNDDTPAPAGLLSSTDSTLDGVELTKDGTYIIMGSNVFFYEITPEARADYQGGFFDIRLNER